MALEIIRNDIVNMNVDAIVNTANENAIVGPGVDSAIYKKAGIELTYERKRIGHINIGDARITKGYNLNSKYIIHAVGPKWNGGNNNEEELLSSCYKKSLELAKKYECQSIAFPLISAGNFGFPKHIAIKIAINEISTFLLENEMQIYLVVFGNESFKLSEKLFKSVNSYIDENYIAIKKQEEYYEDNQIRNNINYQCNSYSRENITTFDKNILSEQLEKLDDSFSTTLLKLIDKTNKKDSEIYRKANIDRRLFSKIRSNVNYQPSKTTALAFALALELNLNETKEFIKKAGFALSKSNKFDLIVEYFIINKNYNVFELNEVLFAYNEPLLGSNTYF